MVPATGQGMHIPRGVASSMRSLVIDTSCRRDAQDNYVNWCRPGGKTIVATSRAKLRSTFRGTFKVRIEG